MCDVHDIAQWWNKPLRRLHAGYLDGATCGQRKRGSAMTSHLSRHPCTSALAMSMRNDLRGQKAAIRLIVPCDRGRPARTQLVEFVRGACVSRLRIRHHSNSRATAEPIAESAGTGIHAENGTLEVECAAWRWC